MTPHFFNTIRPLPKYRGGLTQKQVDYMKILIDKMMDARFNKQMAAYALATNYWETGGRMLPVREGFASSNEDAVRIVTRMFNQGRISTNYAVPDPTTGQSYYGRGPVQITWKRNYDKLGKQLGKSLVTTPDLALDPDIGADILVQGMKLGLFTGVSLDDVSEPATGEIDFSNDRKVINGKDRADEIAKVAGVFLAAIDFDMMKKSRIVKASKVSNTTSNLGIGGTLLGAAVGGAQALIGDAETVEEAVVTGIILADAMPFMGPALIVLAFVAFIVVKAQAKKTEQARREDSDNTNY